MAAPVAEESNFPLQNSDLHLHKSIYDSDEDDFTISQLAESKTSLPITPPPPSSTSLLGKRRKFKPVRYGVSTDEINAEKIHPKPNIVITDPSSNCLSSSKCSKSPVESSPAMILAEEFQSSLGSEHPSCIKLMAKAHVGSGYWMSFPQPFSKLFLPKTDSDMIIEDEKRKIHHIKFIAHKNGLSAGWKKFANRNNLLEGDVLIFQLIEQFKFKVYIIRANDMNKEDGGRSLLELEAQTENTIPETDTTFTTPKKIKRQRSPTPPLNDSESEVLEGSRTSKPNLPSTFQDFHIMVKGQCIDSELPEDVKMSYYNLCNSRKELLHDCLPEDLYDKLVVGMIGETVKIANKIKKCKVTVTKEEFGVWDNSLKSFEFLGMKVGFLRERIRRLSRFVLEGESRFDFQKYNEAKIEKKRIEDEIVGLKERCGKLDAIVGGLKEKVGKHEVKFQEEVNAPW
ncbi:unnamed protein product [Lactuca virosa]|uniref:TF-B3 domain-containing protein n=1 Tax=Lactuca virosa TaxID=75947 RepID=A0AAU9LBI7_9ASTR|nr:unnamed protein product [Lactuca virosa]